MNHHELKTWTAYFDAILRGDKPFELRKDDRDYGVGDELHLREWNPHSGLYTGRGIRKRVTYVLRCAPEFGLMEGFCIMGMEDVP